MRGGLTLISRVRLGLGFRLFLVEILLNLPLSDWAGGNQAEWADRLGNNGGNNQI